MAKITVHAGDFKGEGPTETARGRHSDGVRDAPGDYLLQGLPCGTWRGIPMNERRKTVSLRQAGELAGVSRRTIYNWIERGKVTYIRTASGSIRIFEDSLWRPPTPEVPDGVAEQRISRDAALTRELVSLSGTPPSS